MWRLLSDTGIQRKGARPTITIFNRRELITISSQQSFFRIREALSAAGIASDTRIHGAARAAGRARYGTAGLRQECYVYLHHLCPPGRP